MARVAIPVTFLTRAGVTPPAQTNGDVVNNHTIASNDGKLWLEVVSSDAGSQSVSFPFGPIGTVDGVTPADKTVAVPAGATRLIGPFPPNLYNQVDGSLYVNTTVSTTLKFRAYHI